MKVSGKPPFINLEAYMQNVKDKKISGDRLDKENKGLLNSDKVILSPKAREIQQAKKLLDSPSAAGDEKVAEIKKQIQDGTYQVDAKKVAEKLVKDHLLDELL